MVHVQNTQGHKANDGESIRIQPHKTSNRSNRNDEEVSTKPNASARPGVHESQAFYIWNGM